jgi:hypothetical protein
MSGYRGPTVRHRAGFFRAQSKEFPVTGSRLQSQRMLRRSGRECNETKDEDC